MEEARSSLRCVTFTGADERTDVAALERLIYKHPFVEIGLLYSATPEGRNRYPSLDWIKRAASKLGDNCAIHVCGRTARAQIAAGELASLVKHVGRVQVNGTISVDEIVQLYGEVPLLVTQHTAANERLVSGWCATCFDHELLVDGSGGRGQRPEQWLRPETDKMVGFAGGLGPDNLAEEMPRIAAAARGAYWIDMESSLRIDDWFDVDRCYAALKAAEPWFPLN